MNGCLKLKHIADGEKSLVLGCVLGSKHSPERKALSAMSIVGNGDLVSVAIVADGMYSRYFIAPNAGNWHFVGGYLLGSTLRTVGCFLIAFHPTAFPVKVVYYLFGQCYGSA